MKIKMLNENNEVEIVLIGSKRYKQLNNVIADNAKVRALQHRIKRLKERLSEKDKQIRKQVCGEIRRRMTVYRHIEVKTPNDSYEWALTCYDISEILDQVEQAKEEIRK